MSAPKRYGRFMGSPNDRDPHCYLCGARPMERGDGPVLTLGLAYWHCTPECEAPEAARKERT